LVANTLFSAFIMAWLICVVKYNFLEAIQNDFQLFHEKANKECLQPALIQDPYPVSISKIVSEQHGC
jgi:hypothetical protein